MFEASEIDQALEHIEQMPPETRRVQVEVWFDPGWILVYGGERPNVASLLETLVRGRRFRLRGVTDHLQ